MDISKSTQEIVQNEDVSGESDHTPPNAQRLALVHEEASPHLHSKTWMIVLVFICHDHRLRPLGANFQLDHELHPVCITHSTSRYRSGKTRFRTA
jgi:hypothetical protein